jgi:hypothetical protein
MPRMYWIVEPRFVLFRSYWGTAVVATLRFTRMSAPGVCKTSYHLLKVYNYHYLYKTATELRQASKCMVGEEGVGVGVSRLPAILERHNKIIHLT